MNQNYLIIGGLSGIGAHLTAELREQNHHVLTTSRTPQNSDTTPHCQTYDALNPTLLELPETLDGLVYCPGTIQLKPFNRFVADDFRKDFEINVLGAVDVIQQALPSLQKSAQASIVLFSTVAVDTGMPFHSSISASKGAIEGLAKSLAAEFAPHIRVNIIAPSLTRTHLSEYLLNSPAKEKVAAGRHPLQRIGEPTEVASLASFLLSKKTASISGQIIRPDGGLSNLKLF